MREIGVRMEMEIGVRMDTEMEIGVRMEPPQFAWEGCSLCSS